MVEKLSPNSPHFKFSFHLPTLVSYYYIDVCMVAKTLTIQSPYKLSFHLHTLRLIFQWCWYGGNKSHQTVAILSCHFICILLVSFYIDGGIVVETLTKQSPFCCTLNCIWASLQSFNWCCVDSFDSHQTPSLYSLVMFCERVIHINKLLQ